MKGPDFLPISLVIMNPAERLCPVPPIKEEAVRAAQRKMYDCDIKRKHTPGTALTHAVPGMLVHSTRFNIKIKTLRKEGFGLRHKGKWLRLC